MSSYAVFRTLRVTPMNTCVEHGVDTQILSDTLDNPTLNLLIDIHRGGR